MPMRIVSHSTLAKIAGVTRATVTHCHDGRGSRYSNRQVKKAYRLAIALLLMQSREYLKSQNLIKK